MEVAVPHLTRALPALGQVNGRMEGTPLLAWLNQRLRDANVGVRLIAARAVGGLGAAAAAPEILGRLSTLLGDKAAGVQEAAAWAVRGLGAAAATPEILGRLSTLLGDADRGVQWAAAGAVGRLMVQRVRIFEAESGKWEARTVDVLAGEP